MASANGLLKILQDNDINSPKLQPGVFYICYHQNKIIMPSVLVYLHLVWSTKYRESFLNSRDLRTKVWKHIKANAIEKQIYIDTVNGYDDHCHCLVSLRINQTIQEIVQLIKGESSFWINNNGLTEKKFQWQNDYYAASVSGSHVDRVRAYIKNQEKHHQKFSYQDETGVFVRKLGFQQHFDD